MSGRSGYVRSKQHKADLPIPELPAQDKAPSSSSSTGPVSPPKPFLVTPPTVDGETSLEKSNLRIAVESQSSNIRTGLGGIFTFGKKSRKSSQDANTEPRTSETSLGTETFPGPDTVTSKGSKLRLWLGGSSREQEPFTQKHYYTEKNLWFQGQDTLVFLADDGQGGPPDTPPSFLCSSEAIKSMNSIALNSMLEENGTDRKALIKIESIYRPFLVEKGLFITSTLR